MKIYSIPKFISHKIDKRLVDLKLKVQHGDKFKKQNLKITGNVTKSNCEMNDDECSS